MRDYVAYAKAHCHPKLTEEAGQNLIEKYVKMRQAMFETPYEGLIEDF